MGDFHQYYGDAARAPVLSLVIGGNHEASNYLAELPYGGWLAPNIYYLGYANVVRYGSLRIAGLSGIYGPTDYHKPHHEQLPYDRDEMRSVYHVRDCDVARLLRVRLPIDIGLSHDWPRRVDYFGDCERLFAEHPGFLDSAKHDNLGSEPAERVFRHLRPQRWFSGHMHTRFEATVEHNDQGGDFFRDLLVPETLRKQLPRSVKTRRKLSTRSPGITNPVTHFLALEKPGPGREFLELLEIDSCWDANDVSTAPYLKKGDAQCTLSYDEEWLSILRSTHSCGGVQADAHGGLSSAEDALDWVRKNVTANGLLPIPMNFNIHAPMYDPSSTDNAEEQPRGYLNGQTEVFRRMLDLASDDERDGVAKTTMYSTNEAIQLVHQRR